MVKIIPKNKNQNGKEKTKYKRKNKYDINKKVVGSKYNNKKTRIKKKIIKLRKIKQRNNKQILNPSLINKNSGFFYDMENLDTFNLDIDHKNKLKLSIDEINFLNKLINEIEKENIYTNKKGFIPVSLEIFENINKLIPVEKQLDKREILIKSIINENSYNTNISLRKIKEIYENKTDNKISISTLSYIMKYSLGLRYLKTTVKPKVLSSVKFKKKSFILLRIVFEILFSGMNIIFIDETKLQIKNSNFHMWRNKNDSFNYSTINQDKINLILGVSKNNVIHYEFIKKNINEKIFKGFLEHINNKLGEDEKKSTVFFFDNARPHKSSKIKKYYEESSLKIITNIPYESSFNMVELSFRYIKNIIYKKIFSNINDIINEVKFILESKKFLDSLPLQFKETLQKYIYYNNKYKSENLNEEESIN